MRLPFLDFTTLAERRRFCEEELRLNRRLAPRLYLDVVEVRDGPEGPSLRGRAGRLSTSRCGCAAFPTARSGASVLAAGRWARACRCFARRLAGFHRGAAVAPTARAFGGRRRERVTAGSSLASTPGSGLRPAAPSGRALREWLDPSAGASRRTGRARLRGRQIRECHGDLHLANVCSSARSDRFDAIEFDPELRWIDMLDDLAFLAMDLLAHGRRDLAFRSSTLVWRPAATTTACRRLRFFLVVARLVRPVGGAARGARHRSGAPLRAPTPTCGWRSTFARGSDPRLAITHGLPGRARRSVAGAARGGGRGARPLGRRAQAAVRPFPAATLA